MPLLQRYWNDRKYSTVTGRSLCIHLTLKVKTGKDFGDITGVNNMNRHGYVYERPRVHQKTNDKNKLGYI